MRMETIYGVSSESVDVLKHIIEKRKEKQSFSRMMNREYSASGFACETHGNDGILERLLESNEACVVKFETTPAKAKIKVFASSDIKREYNLIEFWKVKYLCQG